MMKRLNRFIAISLVLACCQSAFACLWIETHNYYLFHVYDSEEFSTRVNNITKDNWKAYLGSTEEYFYFDANEVRKFAEGKGDALMASYVSNLEKYLDCASSVSAEAWNYPSKEDIAKRNQTLTAVRQYAQSKLSSRLRSQHALLFMRCNMLLGRHAENVEFWEQRAVNFIETVYKDMMKNIYAGALLKTGNSVKAGQLFAEMGDWQSLMTQYYKKRSYQAIREEYLRDANSAVLPFQLQDFVNNAQEAFDANEPGKLFVRDISKQEARQMIQLCGQVLKEARSQMPAMWMSAKAWLEFMFDSRAQALADINEAVNLDGTEWMKNCARVLKLYISASEKPVNAQFDQYVAGELKWMDQMKKEDYFFERALDRTIHQVLADKYAMNQRPKTSQALLGFLHETDAEYEFSLDTMEVKSLELFLDYLKRPDVSPLDKLLASRISVDPAKMNDLVGTKYLRICHWTEAIKWLKQVPLSFYNKASYAVYAANRSFRVEPWMKRQWLKSDMEYSGEEQRMTTNPKLDFANEMLAMENRLTLLKGKDYEQACYDLASRYAQASFTGDCWFIMRNGKSIYDKVRDNETDLNKQAVRLLCKAVNTTDKKLKERVLFALAYENINPDSWYKSEWDSSISDYRIVPLPDSWHYKALAALVDYERANGPASPFVSRCDNYNVFRKQYK
jgi:hypothetical protein